MTNKKYYINMEDYLGTNFALGRIWKGIDELITQVIEWSDGWELWDKYSDGEKFYKTFDNDSDFVN